MNCSKMSVIKMTQRIHFFILLSIFLTACQNPNPVDTFESNHLKLDPWKIIESSNDYFPYSNYLNHFPESEHFDSAIFRYQRFQKAEWDTTGYPIVDCLRDCCEVIVDSSGKITMNQQSIALHEVRQKAFLFISQRNFQGKKPDSKMLEDGRNTRKISKGVFYIHISHSQMRISQQVVVELKKAEEDYRNRLSLLWDGKTFSHNNAVRQQFLAKNTIS